MKLDLGTIKKASTGFRYDPDTYGRRLEQYLQSKNIFSIGKFIDNGRLRTIDLTQESRAWRTLWIKDLTMGQIEEVHEWERKTFPDRLSYSWEAQDFLRIERREYVIKKNHLPILIEFNNKNRPLMAEFQGLKIPAYFPDDLEFDGMEYQQAWDKSVYFKDLPNLPDRTRQTVSGAVLGEM